MKNLETHYKKLSYWSCAAFLMVALALSLWAIGGNQFFNIIEIIAITGFVVCLSFSLVQAIILVRVLPGKVTIMPLLAGMFLVIGGAIFDMGVTVTLSPDLSQEGNPIVKMLLDLNVSLTLIYWFGLIVQILAAALISILWACFLKSYPILLKTIPYKNLLTTYKWVTGSGEASIKGWLLGRNTNIHWAWTMTSLFFTIVMSSFYSWYVALEWLKLVPISRIIVPIGLLFGSTWGLVLFTHYRLRCIYAPYLDCRTARSEALVRNDVVED